MSHDPEEREAYGSLVEMFPQLAATSEPIPLAPVHVRALAFEEGDELTVGFIVWKDPGGVRALRRELGERIEAALLSVLSRSADELNRDGERRPSRIVLMTFDAIDGDVGAALAPFGLREVPYEPSAFAQTMALVRGEAQRCGAAPPDVPVAIYAVSVALPDEPRGTNLQTLEAVLREGLAGIVWGEKPGSHFLALSASLGAIDEAPLTPETSSLDRIESIVGQLVPGRIRWIPPLVFQAVCDAVGVIATKELGRKIDWAPCEAEDDGLTPPPLLRARLPDGMVHIPIGEHILRWSMMPLAEGELPPPLSDWLVDQFGDR